MVEKRLPSIVMDSVLQTDPILTVLNENVAIVPFSCQDCSWTAAVVIDKDFKHGFHAIDLDHPDHKNVKCCTVVDDVDCTEPFLYEVL